MQSLLSYISYLQLPFFSFPGFIFLLYFFDYSQSCVQIRRGSRHLSWFFVVGASEGPENYDTALSKNQKNKYGLFTVKLHVHYFVNKFIRAFVTDKNLCY